MSWNYIVGIAIGAFIVGFLLGCISERNERRRSS